MFTDDISLLDWLDSCDVYVEGATFGSVKCAKVMFNYKAEDESNITIKKGDIVVVTDSSDSEWWLGYNEHETHVNEGYFPASFVEMMPPSKVDLFRHLVEENATLSSIIYLDDNEILEIVKSMNLNNDDEKKIRMSLNEICSLSLDKNLIHTEIFPISYMDLRDRSNISWKFTDEYSTLDKQTIDIIKQSAKNMDCDEVKIVKFDSSDSPSIIIPMPSYKSKGIDGEDIIMELAPSILIRGDEEETHYPNFDMFCKLVCNSGSLQKDNKWGSDMNDVYSFNHVENTEKVDITLRELMGLITGMHHKVIGHVPYIDTDNGNKKGLFIGIGRYEHRKLPPGWTFHTSKKQKYLGKNYYWKTGKSSDSIAQWKHPLDM